jgi:hypothetical protein
MRCPFCGADSGRGKEKFVLFLDDDGLYTGHNCFVCQDKGSGVFGLKRIFDTLGKPMSVMDLDEMTAQGRSSRARPAETESSGVVEWPPPWIETDDLMTDEAVAYLEGRGIMSPRLLLKKYGVVASRVVLTSRGSVMPYKSVIWPMHAADGSVIGWSSRAIEDSLGDLPKSITMPGSGWKEQAVFGSPFVDPRLPITVVEGFVSALATPNSVATCGKAIGAGQISLIAGLGSRDIILALDPDVKTADVQKVETSFIMAAPEAEVHVVPWSAIDGSGKDYGKAGGDPADRGVRVMASIIKKIKKGESFYD